MTTLFTSAKKCAFCGREQEVQIIESSNTFGYMDLDTRPAFMERENLPWLVQLCEHCGYCQTNLEAKISVPIDDIISGPFNPDELHQRYYRAYLIDIREHGHNNGSYQNILRAAWCCDDAAMPEEAKKYRLATIDDIKANMNHKDYLVNYNDNLLLIDLYRRTRLFDEARKMLDLTVYNKTPEIEGKILTIQAHLVATSDSGCYTVGDAVNFGKKRPGDKLGVLFPEPSPDDLSLGFCGIAGSFAAKNYKELARQLHNGDIVLLCREPDNQYDRNAIRVTTVKDEKLGYIPKRQNQPLAQMIDEGNLLYGMVVYKMDGDTELMLEIFQSVGQKKITEFIPIKSLQRFDFEIRCSFGEFIGVHMSGSKQKVMRFVYSPDSWEVSNWSQNKKHPLKQVIHGDVVYKEILLGQERLNDFIAALSDCRINYWHNLYDSECLDGYSWTLKFKVNNEKQKAIQGFNAYPPRWIQFLRALAEYVDRQFEKNIDICMPGLIE